MQVGFWLTDVNAFNQLSSAHKSVKSILLHNEEYNIFNYSFSDPKNSLQS